ncbi:methionyl-tRNA formyltransferase [Kaarinaea lacus]
MKVAYCGYDFFHGCLRHLIANDHEILKVFTFDCDNRYNFNRYVHEICELQQIPITQTAINSADLQHLQEQGCELLITAGYRYKVPALDSLAIKGINVHPTLLPIGRGVWPLPWLILKQHTHSGVSIHKLTADFDAGDVLKQTRFIITADENLESLSCKTQIFATEVLAAVMRDFDVMWHNATFQDHNKASMWPMPQRSDRTLEWNNSVLEIDRVCRAFGKFGSFAFFDNRWWCVYDLKVWQQIHHEAVGKVVHKSNTEMVISASDGFVCLRTFEPLADWAG